MTGFARTVFGDDFDADSVVTESRLDLAEWTVGAAGLVAGLGLTPRRLARADLAGVNAAVAERPREEASDRAFALLGAVYDTDGGTLAEKAGDDAELLLALVRAHPLVQELVTAAEQAVHLGDLAALLFPSGQRPRDRRRGRPDHLSHPPGGGAQLCPGGRRTRRARG